MHPTSPSAARRAIPISLWILAVGGSAFLLFLVQPMAGKRLLPWFGGSAAVWTSCLLFFQITLLLGYLYAHLSAHHVPRRLQPVLHGLLLGLACLVPLAPSAGWMPEGTTDPVTRVLAVLAATVGLPFLALAGSGPLLQSWFAASHPGRSPYPLYAMSNAGSLLALIAYPLLIEPRWTLSEQSSTWRLGLALLLAITLPMIVRIAGESSGTIASDAAISHEREPLPAARTGTWLGWSACGVILFMAVTNQMTLNLAAVPFLWILPLAIYLLSFILAFSGERRGRRTVTALAFVPATIAIYVGLLGTVGFGDSSWIELQPTAQLTVLGAGLFLLCLGAHVELHQARPPAAGLTRYYLTIAAGGAIGGAFVALVAPRWLLVGQELLVGLVLFAALGLRALWREAASPLAGGRPRLAWAGLILLALLPLGLLSHHASLLLDGAVDVRRGPYGTLRVIEWPGPDPAPHRRLYHGSTMHGSQWLAPQARHQPTAYYSLAGGGGTVVATFRTERPRRVGLVGLGVGALAALALDGDRFTFYEIDPNVEALARERFHFLADSAAACEVRLGDARLLMAAEPDQQYDILVLDAFSGDAVPVHLVTDEAFTVYRRHLAPGGVIAVHISNRNVDLSPVLYGAAERQGLRALHVATRTGRPDLLVSRSEWMLMTENEPYLQEIVARFRPWQQQGRVGLYVGDPQRYRRVRPWTDDYSNLLEVLR